MLDIIDRIANWLFALAIVACVFNIFGGDAYLLIRDIFMSRRRLNSLKKHRTYNIHRLLAVVSGDRSNTGRFILLSVVIAAIFFIVLVSLSGSMDIWILIVSVGAGMFPFLIQWGRLQNMRIKGSYEGPELITTLANNYVVHNNNAILALDATMVSLKNCPYSKLNIARLSKAVKVFQTEEEIQDAIDSFVYAYRTEWASILGFCLFTGIYDGLNISSALSSLIDQLKRAQQVMERSKRYNREAFRLLTVMVPVTYIGLMYYGSTLYGTTFGAIMAQQFTNPLGLKLFLTILIMTCFCVILGTTVARPKYDL